MNTGMIFGFLSLFTATLFGVTSPPTAAADELFDDVQVVCVGKLSGRVRSVPHAGRCRRWERVSYLTKAFVDNCPCYTAGQLEALPAALACDTDPINREFSMVELPAKVRANVNWQNGGCQYMTGTGDTTLLTGLTNGELRTCEWLIVNFLDDRSLLCSDTVLK